MIMKYCFLFSVLMAFNNLLLAQHATKINQFSNRIGNSKPSIEMSVFDKWPTLNKPIISNDGKYVVYIINKIPFDASTLVIQSTKNNWKKEIVSSYFKN